MTNAPQDNILFDDVALIESTLGSSSINSSVKTDCDCAN